MDRIADEKPGSQHDRALLLKISGERSENVRLLRTDASKAQKDVEFGSKVSASVLTKNSAAMSATQLATLFVDDASLPWEPVTEGIRRKIMTYDANLMLVKVAFDAGGIGAAHDHPHTQMSYVDSGVFTITIGDETRTMRAGDVYYIPPGVWHGAVCVEAGILVDVFTPMREDLV